MYVFRVCMGSVLSRVPLWLLNLAPLAVLSSSVEVVVIPLYIPLLFAPVKPPKTCFDCRLTVFNS